MSVRINFRPARSAIASVSLALGSAVLAAPTQAAVTIIVERIDDTRARLSASGTLGPDVPWLNDHALAISAPFAADPAMNYAAVLVASTMQIGDVAVNYASALSKDLDIFFNGTAGLTFGNAGFSPFAANAAVSGHIDLLLENGATFAPIGTRGQVQWGIGPWPQPPVVGTWEIVSASPVPEPAPVMLGMIGAAVLLVARRRSGKGEPHAHTVG